MIVIDESNEESITMRSYRRAGSEVVVHVNGDWSGTALIALSGLSAMAELPVVNLLRGDVSLAEDGPVSSSSLVEAVSIAVEAFVRQSLASAIGTALTVQDFSRLARDQSPG